MSKRASTYGPYKLFAVALVSFVVGLGLAHSSPLARLRLSDNDGGSLQEVGSSAMGTKPGQFMALSARSLLPLKSRNELAGHEELPTTTKRPSEFSLPVL